MSGIAGILARLSCSRDAVVLRALAAVVLRALAEGAPISRLPGRLGQVLITKLVLMTKQSRSPKVYKISSWTYSSFRILLGMGRFYFPR